MIDQATGVRHFQKFIPGWKIKIGGRVISYPTPIDKRGLFDPLGMKSVTNKTEWITDVMDDSTFERERRHDFVRSHPELESRLFKSLKDNPLPDTSLQLFLARVYGYSMMQRKWFPFDINQIEDISEDRSTRSHFEDLVLPEGHRKLLQALVKTKVGDPKEALNGLDEELDEFSMGLVKGKGKGLVILLHGVPGVGKTTTAECVASQLRRPLLPITCGDIGIKAAAAQASLETFCDLARRWRCVLLLDEADVFLAKREKGDLKRNGLVSVFLRVLEYYSGVMFLTTNRVGEFDEAFRSRIHIILYYPRLNRESTKQVWERNIAFLKSSTLDIDIEEDAIRRFYEDHWEGNLRHPSRRWNGRQIKNAFQTALALANWDFHEDALQEGLERPVLCESHFRRVVETSEHFDDYISEVHGTEGDVYAELARREQFREDANVGLLPRRRSVGRANRSGFMRRRHGIDRYDDESAEDESDMRVDPYIMRKPPGARYAGEGRRTATERDYGDEGAIWTGGRNRAGPSSRRTVGNAVEKTSEKSEAEDPDDIERLKLQLKLARLKKNKRKDEE